MVVNNLSGSLGFELILERECESILLKVEARLLRLTLNSWFLFLTYCKIYLYFANQGTPSSYKKRSLSFNLHYVSLQDGLDCFLYKLEGWLCGNLVGVGRKLCE